MAQEENRIMISHKFVKYIVFMGMVLVFLTACQSHLEENVVIENPNSVLLTGLIQITDFSSDWRWIYSDMSQTKEVPTNENRHLLEKAAHGLTGLYGDERHYIRIFHILEKYKEISREGVSDSTENITPTDKFTLIIDDNINAECIRETSSRQPATIFCKTNVDYNNLTSIVTIYAPDHMDNETLTAIFAQTLSTINERIQEMQ